MGESRAGKRRQSGLDWFGVEKRKENQRRYQSYRIKEKREDYIGSNRIESYQIRVSRSEWIGIRAKIF